MIELPPFLQVVVVKQRDLDRSRLREMIANWYECAVADNVEARKYEQVLEMARQCFPRAMEVIVQRMKEGEGQRERGSISCSLLCQ